MTDTELSALLRDLESDRCERKESASDGDKIRQAICAFANDLPNHNAPGVVFVGVRDDGTLAGLPMTDQLLLTLSNMKSDGNIVPFPSLTVRKLGTGPNGLAAIIVQPSDAPPVRYKGRVWIRVGPRRDFATPEEERRLAEKRRSRDLPFDLHTVASAAKSDLDLDLFSRTYLRASVAPEVLEENQRSVDQHLASLRLARTEGARLAPTVFGLLVAGREPDAFIPGAWVQFLRIDGTGLADPVRDSARFSGPLSEMLPQLENKLQAHLETARDFTSGPAEIATPDYPWVAIQQLVRNAILHRNYDGTSAPVRISWFNDRIEILSPGGPYGQVTAGNFGQPGVTDYRNPHLAEAMRNLGFVQRFGAGIAIARRELETNGNPALEFTVETSNILATLRKGA